MMKQSICVIGMGYIGLPTAVIFANNGHQVHGVDVDPRKVTLLQKGEVPIEEPFLQENLNEAIASQHFTVSTSPVASDVFIVAVPSPIQEDKTANFDYIRAATEAIVPVIQKGNLVVLESTVPPRTVEDVMLPILEKSGLVIGEELFVSHSPERVIPGKVFQEIVSNDRIIGGINEVSTQKTVELYRSFVKGTMHETDATTAELVKVMENTYRDVNIALANELAKISASIGVNVWEAIQLANYHPRVNLHQPGPGVGGHCIAVDPWFLVSMNEVNTPLIHTARQTNDEMPKYTAMLTKHFVGDKENAKVAVLGLAFKGDIDDWRESPALDVIAYLKQQGMQVAAFDPHIHENILKEQTQVLEEAVKDASAIVIVTNHTEFKELQPLVLKTEMNKALVIDTKNCIAHEEWQQAGFQVEVLGNSKGD